ncbi:response regulator [Phenylobacterium sp. LjRoot225]|uniref:response regulator n=1 Tax=Phenylobacterium sp. LjRoot225 TaxID=3342285 RepID=UPI003ECD49A2
MIETLTGARLLVVEDETLVAMMVEDMLSDLGCVVVNVAGSVSTGLALLADPALALDGAILDVNLGGEKVYPVADALAAKGIPFMFATGYGIGGIAESYSHLPALAKPYEPQVLEKTLASLFERTPKVTP